MLSRLYCNSGNVIPCSSCTYQRSGVAADDLTIVWTLYPFDETAADGIGDGVELGHGNAAAVADVDDEYEAHIPLAVSAKMTAGEKYVLTIVDAENDFGIRADIVADYYRGEASEPD